MWWLVMLACSSPVAEPAPPAAPDQVAASAVNKPPPSKVDAHQGPVVTVDLYGRLANELVAAIDAKGNPDVVAARAQRLTLTGVGLLSELEKKHPECAPYFAAIAKVAPKLGDFDLERIEKGFHLDGELPKSPGPACYHGKDLVVHPATVVAMAVQGLKTEEARKAAKDEITEVLSHLKAVE